MSKFRAIFAVLTAHNFVVITDRDNIGAVSPLCADRFKETLQDHIDGLSLVQHRHKQLLEQIADRGLGDE